MPFVKDLVVGAEKAADKPVANYARYSYDDLLNAFCSETWGQFLEENRVALVQEIENRNAAAQGRRPAEIVSNDCGGNYGEYVHSENRIYINMSFSSYDVLDTYIHESNHAIQQQSIENGTGYDKHTMTMLKSEMAQNERGNLYNYRTRGIANNLQCCELDSNNHAAEFLLKQRERYDHDPQYRAYIKKRAEHFVEVNTSLDNRSEARVNMQDRQSYVAYVRGDISEEEYNAVAADNKSEHFCDLTAERSKSLGRSIAEIDKEYNQQGEYGQESAVEEYTDKPDSFENIDTGEDMGYADGVAKWALNATETNKF